MASDYTKDLEQVVRTELLPVYLKHTKQPAKEVLDIISNLNTRTAQVAALFKPPKK